MLQKTDDKILIHCHEIPRLISSPLTLFYEKLGIYIPRRRIKESELLQIESKDMMLNMWQYWHAKKYIENYHAKKPFRIVERNYDTFINTDIPFIAITPDAIIKKDINGKDLDRPSPIKTLNIGPKELGITEEELQTQMMIMATDYSEKLLMNGGSKFTVEKCNLNEALTKQILDLCSNFWFNKIIPAQPLAKLYHKSSDRDKKIVMKDLKKIEPVPEPTEIDELYYRSRMGAYSNKMIATREIESLINAYQFLDERIKRDDRNRRRTRNCLMRIHERNGVGIIESEFGYSTASLIIGRSIREPHLIKMIKTVNEQQGFTKVKIKAKERRDFSPSEELMNRINEGSWSIKVSLHHCKTEQTALSALEALYIDIGDHIYGHKDNDLCPINPYKLIVRYCRSVPLYKVRRPIVQYRIFGEEAFWNQIKIETGLLKEGALKYVNYSLVAPIDKKLIRIIHDLKIRFDIPEHMGFDREEEVCFGLLRDIWNLGPNSESLDKALEEIKNKPACNDVVEFLSRASRLQIIEFIKHSYNIWNTAKRSSTK